MGAVIQHFPLTLDRVDGIDFRLPDDAELDALEAFQLSLGRQADPILEADNNIGLKLKNSDAILGKAVFVNGPRPEFNGRCNTCHFNAGATSGRHLQGRPEEEGVNRNVATGAEFFPLPDGSNRHDVLDIPVDGGFGRVNRSVNVLDDTCDDGVTTAASPTCCIAPSKTCGIGDGRFNSPPLIESVDTPPFFHNNAFNTIEEAVAFYNSALFNAGRGANEIQLTNDQITQVATLLRVLNALENIRSAIQLDDTASSANSDSAKESLGIALAELEDAIQVLDEKLLHPQAVGQLRVAMSLTENAIKVKNDDARKNLIKNAIKKTISAREDMCVLGSDPVLCPD